MEFEWQLRLVYLRSHDPSFSAHQQVGSFGKRCLIEVGEGIEKKGQAFLPTLVSSFKFPFAVFHIPTVQEKKKSFLVN